MNNSRNQPSKDCYAVIFSSQRTRDKSGYEEISERMADLAAKQPGFIDFESVRDDIGSGITISY